MNIEGSKTGWCIFEVVIRSGQTTVIEDVCDQNGFVDEEFIASLKELAKQLEQHNKELKA